MPHCQVYTAAAGDTIAGLAAAFGVSHQELFAANPLYGDAELAGGDPVYIPPWSPMECRTWAGPTPK
jgi:LysM repeat protein